MTYQGKRGERVSTETAYLTADVLGRKNLTVVMHALVSKVLFESQDGEPRATAVDFSRGKGQKVFRVKAKKEIIVR